MQIEDRLIIRLMKMIGLDNMLLCANNGHMTLLNSPVFAKAIT